MIEPIEIAAVDSVQPVEEAIQIPLLPRNAWHNQIAFLKIILSAKLLLDQIEREHNR